MKRTLCTFKGMLIALMLLFAANIHAQDFDNISQPGIYYLTTDSVIKPVLSLNASGSKASGTFRITIRMQYPGENADLILNDTQPTFYALLSPYTQQSVRNYRLISLEAKKGNRFMNYITASIGGAHQNDESIQFTSEQVEENVFKIVPSEPLAQGHYAFFYNYGGGMPAMIYDFDIE